MPQQNECVKWNAKERKKDISPLAIIGNADRCAFSSSIDFLPFAWFCLQYCRMHFAHDVRIVYVLILFWINVGKLTTHKMPLNIFTFFVPGSKFCKMLFIENKFFDIFETRFLVRKYNFKNWRENDVYYNFWFTNIVKNSQRTKGVTFDRFKQLILISMCLYF